MRKEELNSIKSRWEKRCLRERELGGWVWQVWKEGTTQSCSGSPPSPAHPGLTFSDQLGLGLEGWTLGLESREENPRVTWDDSSIPTPICHLSIPIYLSSICLPSICPSIYNLFVLHLSSSLYIVKQGSTKSSQLPQSPQFLALHDFPFPHTDHPTLL